MSSNSNDMGCLTVIVLLFLFFVIMPNLSDISSSINRIEKYVNKLQLETGTCEIVLKKTKGVANEN